MSTPSGQWMTSNEGARWFFDSGALCLDFAHSGSSSAAVEQLASPADLAGWLLERFPHVDSLAAERDLDDALLLRTAILGIARSLANRLRPASADIDTVNLYAATPDVPPALTGGTRQAGASRVRIAQALSTIARDAVALCSGEGAGRLRSCASAECELVFFDDSRAGTRRWCSMQRCGNRAKVRAFRSRASGTDATAVSR